MFHGQVIGLDGMSDFLLKLRRLFLPSCLAASEALFIAPDTVQCQKIWEDGFLLP